MSFIIPPKPTFIEALVDEAKTSDATLAVDSELVANLDAGRYTFEYLLLFRGALAANGGVQFQLSETAAEGLLPCVRTGEFFNVPLTIVDNMAEGVVYTEAILSWPVGYKYVGHGGYIEVSSADAVGISWAQNTSHANATSRIAGSWMRFTRID